MILYKLKDTTSLPSLNESLGIEQNRTNWFLATKKVIIRPTMAIIAPTGNIAA